MRRYAAAGVIARASMPKDLVLSVDAGGSLGPFGTVRNWGAGCSLAIVAQSCGVS